MRPNAENSRSETGTAGERSRREGEALSCLETPVISEHFPQRRQLTENRRNRRPNVPDRFPFIEPDPLETPEPSDGDTSEEFNRARKDREKLKARLEEEEAEDLLEKIEKCGRKLNLHCTSCGRIHQTETRCNLKWCPVCSRKRAARLSMKYRKASRLMEWPMHVTLTRKNMSWINESDIDALKKGFKALRRRSIFVDNVIGGVKAVELTNTGKGWHPHLHVLCDCKWLSNTVPEPMKWHSRAMKANLCQRASQELQEEWSDCIGQLVSSIKVRRCDGHTAVAEVLKYAVKPGDLVTSPDPVAEAIRAISAGRLVSAFGTLYNMRAELKDEEKPSMPCPSCGAAKAWMPEEQVAAIIGASRRDRRK